MKKIYTYTIIIILVLVASILLTLSEPNSILNKTSNLTILRGISNQTQQINQDNLQNINNDNNKQTNKRLDENINSDFASCSSTEYFGCKEVTQGVAYDYNNPPPEVCGCIPITCPEDKRIIVASLDKGNWPDNSLKGIFECSDSAPPSAAG